MHHRRWACTLKCRGGFGSEMVTGGDGWVGEGLAVHKPRPIGRVWGGGYDGIDDPELAKHLR
jgi:hypothetical protein